MVRSQFDTLIPNLSFSHNLCYRPSNGSCKPILNIQVLKKFQWYKEVFNPMSFDPSNHFLKIWDLIGIPTPKMGVHLGLCGFIPSQFFTFSKVWMWILGCIICPHLSMPLLSSWAQGVVTPWSSLSLLCPNVVQIANMCPWIGLSVAHDKDFLCCPHVPYSNSGLMQYYVWHNCGQL
jgi:hypothetical protein